MLLVDLNYNLECDWFVELSDNNLARELVVNRSFFIPITTEEIVIFMVSGIIECFMLIIVFQCSSFYPAISLGPSSNLSPGF